MARNTATTRASVPTLNLNTCLSFNGTTSKLVIPDNNVYSYATNNALSISVWFNPSTLTFTGIDTGYIDWFSKVDYPNQREWTFRMYSQGNTESRNNRISFYMYALATSLGDGAYFEDEVIAGEWIHLVATVDGSKNIRLYKNGKLRNVFLASALTFADGTSSVYVGATNASDNGFFNGLIDEIRFFNYVLSDAQILDLYNKNSVTTTGQVGWFKLDEGVGSTAIDSSSTANNGTITNAGYLQSLIKGRRKITDVTPVVLNSTATVVNVLPTRNAILGGKSLSLNGTSQYASIANASQTGLDIGTKDFMVGGVFKIFNNSSIQVLFDKHSGTGYALSNVGNIGFDLLWRGDVAGKPIQLRLTDGTTNVTCATTTDQLRLADGNWHSLIVSVSRTGKANFYLDGSLVASVTTNTALLTLTNTGAFMIGARVDGTVGFVGGLVQNAFMYVFPNLVPTNITTIVRNIYKYGIYDTFGLVSRWSFNNDAIDSVRSNNLTLTGSPSYSTDTQRGVRLSA